MPIMEWLRTAGGRLGLVRFVSTSAPATGPKKVPTRVVTLKELLAEARAAEPPPPSAAPADLARSFEEIYRDAGITPPVHGWTVQRLAEWLRAEADLKAPRETLQLGILHKLASEQAHVQDIVRDALARDQALDAYEVAIGRAIEEREAVRRARTEQLEQEIRSLKASLSQIAEESRRDAARLEDWRARKATIEQEMAWTLDFLINEKVVSTNNGAAKRT